MEQTTKTALIIGGAIVVVGFGYLYLHRKNANSESDSQSGSNGSGIDYTIAVPALTGIDSGNSGDLAALLNSINSDYNAVTSDSGNQISSAPIQGTPEPAPVSVPQQPVIVQQPVSSSAIPSGGTIHPVSSGMTYKQSYLLNEVSNQ